MYSLTGYIDGNTLIATDESLRSYEGGEILIRIVQNPNSHKNNNSSLEEKSAALNAIRGVLHQNKAMTIADIRAERLGI